MTSRKRSRMGLDDSAADVVLPSKRVLSPDLKRTFSPKLNSYEDIDEDTMSTMVIAILGLPGLKPGDVTINLLHNKLTISGEFVVQQPQLGEGLRTHYTTCCELPSGKFSRVLTVPLGMRPEDFKARMEDGLLTLTFPKDPPKQEPHRIPIK